MWYECHENIGKAIAVRDSEDEYWTNDIFEYHVKESERPFKCLHNNWAYARPLQLEDIRVIGVVE